MDEIQNEIETLIFLLENAETESEEDLMELENLLDLFNV